MKADELARLSPRIQELKECNRAAWVPTAVEHVALRNRLALVVVIARRAIGVATQTALVAGDESEPVIFCHLRRLDLSCTCGFGVRDDIGNCQAILHIILRHVGDLVRTLCKADYKKIREPMHMNAVQTAHAAGPVLR